MDPGRLNKRIKIVKADEEVQNDYGESTQYDLVHECWSSVKNKSGTEQFKAHTPFSIEVTSFLIRYTKKPLDSSMIVIFNDFKYKILQVDNYNFSNSWIEITAEKVG